MLMNATDYVTSVRKHFNDYSMPDTQSMIDEWHEAYPLINVCENLVNKAVQDSLPQSNDAPSRKIAFAPRDTCWRFDKHSEICTRDSAVESRVSLNVENRPVHHKPNIKKQGVRLAKVTNVIKIFYSNITMWSEIVRSYMFSVFFKSEYAIANLVEHHVPESKCRDLKDKLKQNQFDSYINGAQNTKITGSGTHGGELIAIAHTMTHEPIDPVIMAQFKR